MNEDDWMSKCRNIEVEGSKPRGRPRKTWQECVNNDMKIKGLSKDTGSYLITQAWIMGLSSAVLSNLSPHRARSPISKDPNPYCYFEKRRLTSMDFHLDPSSAFLFN